MIKDHIVDWIGIRVESPQGPGTIIKIEQHFIGEEIFFRYGVRHDVFPADKPRKYKEDVLYYRYKYPYNL